MKKRKKEWNKDTFSFRSARDKKSDKRPADSDSDDSSEQIAGKLSYSDVYVIGKGDKTDLLGTRANLSPSDKARLREIEGQLVRKRFLASEDFLRYYKEAQELLSPGEREGEKKTPSKRKKLKEDAPKDLPLPSVQRGKAGRNVGSEPGERGSSAGLRIIGGRLRGSRLKYGGDNRVRPMKDRVRESVFNLIGTAAKGLHAVDLFAGTGALTFEAISRGAASGTMIEIHFPSARIIRDNIAALEEKEAGFGQKIDLITTDIFFFAREEKNLADRIPHEVPWLVFCSPPYDFYLDRQEEMLDLIEKFRKAAPKESLFVIEADERFDFDLLGVPLLPSKRRSYPPAEIGIFAVS
ncbi:MAG: RsmD family RNA methyltransferase [Planctomycetia bacterium]|nr:RsmD family RNA methyltransferase [Planctomycetia bacterium]